ncbi:unnamed protein product [Ilex paraguariensis]|uniref:NB-ARC domain-containing protein n=1 Tax=Ilex paraguariensis TaxID=185542 RepID=A0ABC8U4V6_9AQUA
MGGEIEKYLLEKLDEALNDQSSNKQNLWAKMFHLHSDFKELKDLLEKKEESTLTADEQKRREKLYQLNNVLTEWQMISKKQGSCNPEALHSYELGRRLKQIKADLEKKNVNGVSERGTEVNGQPSLPKVPDRWSSRYVDPEKVHGLEDEAMTLERLLVRGERNDHFKAIGIVGMAGIGKTTLCQFLLTRQLVKDNFLPRIWICMSKQSDDDPDNNSKEIVRRMLVSLGVENEIINSAESHGLSGLLCALRVQLRGKRYLIVLDDAWNPDTFFKQLNPKTTQAGKFVEHLAYALPKGYGGAVIVTSRSEEIAKKMVGEENLHRIPRTDKESCWKIFKDSVQKDGKEFSEDLEKLKDEIVNNCFGLPLAAKMMGQIWNANPQQNSNGSDNQQETQQPTA